MHGYLVKQDMFYGHHTESIHEKNSNKTKIILFLILILLFCTTCGLLLYFFVFYEKNDENIKINDNSIDENEQKEQTNYSVEEKKREELKKKLTLLVQEKTRKALDKEYESDSGEEENENDSNETEESFDDSIVKNKIDMEEVRRQVLNQLEMTQKHINAMEQQSKASQEGKYYKRAGKVAHACMNLLKTHPYFKTLNMAYSLGSLAFSFTGILKNEVDDKSPVSKKVVGELINFVKSKVPTNNNDADNDDVGNPKKEFAEHLLNDFVNSGSQNPPNDLTPVSSGNTAGSVTTMVASLLLGYMTNKIKGR